MWSRMCYIHNEEAKASDSFGHEHLSTRQQELMWSVWWSDPHPHPTRQLPGVASSRGADSEQLHDLPQTPRLPVLAHSLSFPSALDICQSEDGPRTSSTGILSIKGL